MIHADLLGERARISPDRTAIVEAGGGRRLTYAEADARATACARTWHFELGLHPGERIAILSPNRLEMLDAFFAAGKIGIVLVPLNTRLTVPELEYILADCGVRAVMYDAGYRDQVAALKDRVATVERWVSLDPSPDPSDDHWHDLVAAAERERFHGHRPAPEDPYCLLYTSGTTGRPKGVITPHRMVAWNAYNTVLNWQLGENDVSPVFTPLYHAGGLGAFLTPLIAAGGTVVLHQEFDPSQIWRTIESERCTVVLGVPTIWKMLAEAPEFATADLSHVRWFISGGAPLPRHLIDVYRARGVILRQGYGLTEVGVNCFTMTDDEAWRKAGSIGRPLMFTEAKVVDDAGAELAPDKVGELCFRGPHVSAGYWNQPQATAEVYDADGWFHTGDMARVDADGFFYIAGRAKDMFISGGVNVYPAEIENVLLQHPELADAAVIGVEDDTWGEVGIAYLVLRPDADLDVATLPAFLGEHLARYKIPRAFEVVDELPRTPYGKVVKGELVEWWKARAKES
jgi:fatty-acyl-CoA synthase